jgi:two-component system, chemotaxis family, chemotaxis protein CheY
MKTLIVEDDFISRHILQEFLRPYGECHVAVNGKEAVYAYQKSLEQESQYDLICLDIVMPEMDGQEALTEIRGIEESKGIMNGQGVKILMATGLKGISNVAQSYQNNCDGYIVKPFDRSKLIDNLRQLGLIE